MLKKIVASAVLAAVLALALCSCSGDSSPIQGSGTASGADSAEFFESEASGMTFTSGSITIPGVWEIVSND